jgi:hypothetical protein
LQAEKFKVLPVKNRDSVINLAGSELAASYSSRFPIMF